LQHRFVILPNMQFNITPELKYVFSEKGPLLIVTFQGPVSRKFGDILEKSKTEIAAKSESSKCVILNFQDVEEFDKTCLSFFVTVPKMIQATKGRMCRICIADEELRNYLIESGVVNKKEVFSDLPTTLKTIYRK